MTGYILCTAPRSGSTLLCRMLAAAGAGDPESVFNGDSLEIWGKRLGLAPASDELAYARAIFAAAFKAGQGGTPIFALRAQRHSFPLFQHWLGQLYPEVPSDTKRLAQAFGPLRYVYLRRQDKLWQAISYVKAKQSGLFHRNSDGTDYERFAPESALHFDAARIAATMAEYKSYDRDWETWFSAEGITPLSLTYEDLSEDPTGTLRQVLHFLDLDPQRAETIELPVQKLADAVTEDWVARMGQ